MRPTDNGRGVGIGMMRITKPCKVLLGLVVMAAAVGEVRAQNIDTLVTKKVLTGNDFATIEVWVRTRAQRLSHANEKEIEKTEKDVLELVTKQQPSPDFANKFATLCGDLFGPITSQNAEALDMRRSLTAVRILYRLDNPGTAGGLAEALRSPHASARFQAAKAIQALHGKLTDDAALGKVLTALGEAIASETANYLLPELYAALDFKSGNANFKGGNLMAGALAKGFAGRATRLSEGARDEATDMAGLNAALSVVANANTTNKKQLAVATASMMVQATERYLDAQANDTQRATLRQLIVKMEDIITRLIGDSGSPPRVSELLKGANPNSKAVRDALAKWQAAADGL